MRCTQRTHSWLLTSLLAFVILAPAVGGQAGGDTPLVDAARNNDSAGRSRIARQASECERARARWVNGGSLGGTPFESGDGAGPHCRRRRRQHAESLRHHAAAAGQPHGRRRSSRRCSRQGPTTRRTLKVRRR